ncbi:MAG: DUF2382 domain-containing protein [Cyanobacteriota bacterium]|nr:DUF2382 domain-containing protein [Cyanobacteriota bacterium]
MNRPELDSNSTSTEPFFQQSAKELIGYAVVSLQDQIIGRVEKVFLDKNRQLYFVISPSEPSIRSSWAWLAGHLVQTTDTTARSLYVNLSLLELKNLPSYKNPSQTASNCEKASDERSTVLDTHRIPLLEEKLAVKRNRRKVGEIVVRKEVEIRMIQIPLKREKLIVEQIGAETQQLAEIDLGQEEVTGVEYQWVNENDKTSVVSGEFSSLQAAREALDAIALHHPHGCSGARVELVVDREVRETYQKILHRRD